MVGKKKTEKKNDGRGFSLKFLKGERKRMYMLSVRKKKRRKNPANWVERTQLSNKTIVFKTFLQTFLLEGVGLQLLRKQCRM